MENAKKNLVEQITNLVQKYTEECLKINENEKDQEPTNNYHNEDIYSSFNDDNEDLYSSSFNEINDFFDKRKEHNNRVIKLLKELRNGKYDDVFAYYNFHKSQSSDQNSERTPVQDLTSFISDDYPLVKKREQRKDIETFSDPQLVLNFPTTSSLSKNLYTPFNFTNSTPSEKTDLIENPIRKSNVQKKKQAPSIKNILITSNETKDINEESTQNPQKTNNINQLPTNKLNTKTIALSENLTQEPNRNKPQNPRPLSQPAIPLKFLDLYPPDPPFEFNRLFNIKDSNKTKINSQGLKLENNQQKEEQKEILPSKENEKTVGKKSEVHFLSSNSSSNSSLPADSFEPEPTNPKPKSPNPFTSPKLNKERSPFLTTSFKPIISSPAMHSFHFLTSTSNSEKSSHDNSSASAHSSLPITQSLFSSQIHKSQSNSSINNSEEESDEQDSIVDFSSSSSQTQRMDDEPESDQMKPIITGKEIVENERKYFLSEEDTDSYKSDQNQNIEKENNFENIQIPNDKKDQTDSSSEFNESDLSQALQPSGFIFQNDNNSQRNMVRSSENPYSRLDAITRLPIKK